MRRWPSLSLGIVLSAAVAEIACGDSFSADSAPENSSAGEGGEPDGGTAGSGGAGGSSGSGTTGGRGGSTGAGGSTATGGDAGDAGDAGESGTGGAAGNGAMGGGSGVSGASGNGGRGGVSGGGASGRSGAGGGGVGGVSGTGGVGGLGGAGKGGTGGTSGGKGGTGGSGMGGTAGTAGTGGVAGVSGTGGTSCQMNCALNGFTCCNGRCVNTRNDIKNCGTCGEVCDGSFPICLDGQCTIPVCLGPDCGPGRGCCENTCCAIGELCCKVPGGPDGPPRCTVPVDGTCPMGCPECPCASPGTPVATPSGERPIAELRAGDLVYSVHEGAIVAVPIERVSKNPVAGHYVLRLRLETGATLEVSAMHPTADGRTLALAIPGSELGGVRVVTVDEIPYQHAYTYDILPASDTGTYFAAGALIGSTLFAERSARD